MATLQLSSCITLRDIDVRDGHARDYTEDWGGRLDCVEHCFGAVLSAGPCPLPVCN